MQPSLDLTRLVKFGIELLSALVSFAVHNLRQNVATPVSFNRTSDISQQDTSGRPT